MMEIKNSSFCLMFYPIINGNCNDGPIFFLKMSWNLMETVFHSVAVFNLGLNTRLSICKKFTFCPTNLMNAYFYFGSIL